MIQEWIAFGIVALVALLVLRKAYQAILAAPLAAWLLRQGHVKWAMKLRPSGEATGGCGTGCNSNNKCH